MVLLQESRFCLPIPVPVLRSGLLLAIAGILGCCSVTGCGSAAISPLPSVAKPATGQLSGPVLGYVFSASDGTLRAILGVRGSAQMSASMVPAGVYVAGETSTAGSAALLEDGSGSLFAFELPSAQPIHVLDGLAPDSRIAFSASGTTAIAYAAGGSSIALITNLPGTPQVKTITVPAANALAAAVVSDAGAIAMASGGSPMSVGTLSSAGAFSRVATVGALGGLNFIPGSDDLLLADSAANTASVIRAVSTGPSLQTLTIAGMNQPVAIAASQDKKWAVVANGGDGGVLGVDLTSGSAAGKMVCACQPTQLSALADGGTFRVNALYGGPVWTIDLSNSAPQFLFVPAITKGTP